MNEEEDDEARREADEWRSFMLLVAQGDPSAQAAAIKFLKGEMERAPMLELLKSAKTFSGGAEIRCPILYAEEKP